MERPREGKRTRSGRTVNYGGDDFADDIEEEEEEEELQHSKDAHGEADGTKDPKDARKEPLTQRQIRLTVEATTAERQGLPVRGLSRTEEDYASHLDLHDPRVYVNVRNALLTLWRRDVGQWLGKEQALAAVPEELSDTAAAAYDFLHNQGYINFGLSPEILAAAAAQAKERRAQWAPDPPPRVLIVGAGLAGLGAARHLTNLGFDVTILEARRRPGGRVHSLPIRAAAPAPELETYAELGGSIVTGIDGNPLAVLAAQLRVAQRIIDGTTPLYMPDGSQLDADVDRRVNDTWNALLDRCGDFREGRVGAAESDVVGARVPAYDFVRLSTAVAVLYRDGGATWKHQGKKAAAAEGGEEAGKERGQGSPTAGPSGEGPDPALASDAPLGGAAAAAAAASDATPAETAPAPALQRPGSPVGGPLTAPCPPPIAPGTEPPRPTTTPPGLEKRVLDWHVANLEFSCAAPCETLSLGGWDQDDPYSFSGPHVYLEGGNTRLVEALASGLPIEYGKAVHTVRYGQGGGRGAAAVEVGTEDGGVYRADHVILTLPLGVLKAGKVRFEPPLPLRKVQAIQKLNYGVLNKVALLFPSCFWGTTDTFGYIPPPDRPRGEFFLFYSNHSVAGAPVLLALVAGDAALQLEAEPAGSTVARLIEALRGIFEPRGVTVPPLLSAVVSQWGSDPFSLGSYSSVGVGCTGEDEYQAMAEPLGGGLGADGKGAPCRVCFAGEATIHKHPATMHGALISGIREAARINRQVELARAKDKGRQRAEAAARLDTTWAATVAHARRSAAIAEALDKVFARDPDLEFGDVSVVFGAGADREGEGGDPEEAPALIRVAVPDPVDGRRPPLPLYALSPKGLCYRLMDLPDTASVVALLAREGVQLLRRAGLGLRGEEVLRAAAASRGVALSDMVGAAVAEA